MKEAIRCPSWALLLWLLISTTTSAQDIISISGTVTTRADGLSVPGAVVTVVGVDVKATTRRERTLQPAGAARPPARRAGSGEGGCSRASWPRPPRSSSARRSLTVDVALTSRFHRTGDGRIARVRGRGGKGRAGRHHHARADCRQRLRRDGTGDSVPDAVVQLSASDDHRRHRHRPARDAARPGPRSGARARSTASAVIRARWCI